MIRKKGGKRRIKVKMIAAFSLVVFLVVSVTMIIIGALTGALFQSGLLDRQQPMYMVLVFAVSSIIISTILARPAGRRGLSPIIRVSEAAKEIARGNYDVRLDEDIPFQEIREMAQNFNLMAQQLGNTETFRNDFIANVSHEFKTPISAIEGYVTLLQNNDLAAVERDEYVERILKNTGRLSSLSGNILQISSLENQKIKPASQDFSLDEQLRQIILFAEPEWTKKSINLDVDFENVVYSGNKNMLAQVWQNIFDNAVKFAPCEGTVRVILRKQEDGISVAVSDNGIGMEPEVTGRVFEKFYQGDKSHSSSGNGLGLALAKRIVDLHGGTIEVSSTKGKGSTFTVKLPV